ncbi:MAG TPA: protease modulator HflC [Candidatus Paceibacterota bacterium]|nr:protease modulator HflC [Candidatus Paceibacterota bacterium]HRZ55553.1 protease modulator HflC [Candidatus Paceibacterota bacterium]
MHKRFFSLAGLVAVMLAAFVIRQALFTVNETEQVIITQLGEYKRTVQEPGLAWKMPFLQTVNRFDRRILTSDAPKAEYLTQDKKRLVADPVTRWRIADPLQFYKTVRDESGARARLDDLVLSELRREVASHTFDLVIGLNRETIMDNVARTAREKAKEFGIAVVDVRIKRADLPQEVQLSVFQRMQAEREREAKRYRSEGEEESAKLKAETDKQRTILLAQAKQDAEKLRGEGDGTATGVYAEAYGKNAEFYAFVRSLQAYEQFLSRRSTLVLPADSDLFRYLSTPHPQTNRTASGEQPRPAAGLPPGHWPGKAR